MTGIKYDNGKRRWTLVPWRAMGLVADVLGHGALKYSADNWKKVLPDHCGADRYLDATFRHLVAYARGEEADPDSGLPHLAHAVTNLLFLLEGPLIDAETGQK